MGGANKIQRSETVNPPPRFLHGRCARSPFDGRAPVRRMGLSKGKPFPSAPQPDPCRHCCGPIGIIAAVSRQPVRDRAYSIILKVEGSPLEACHPWAEWNLGSLAMGDVPKPAPARRNGPTLGTPLWKSRPPNLHAPIAPFSGTNPEVCPASSQCATGAGQVRRTEYTRHPTTGAAR